MKRKIGLVLLVVALVLSFGLVPAGPVGATVDSVVKGTELTQPGGRDIHGNNFAAAIPPQEIPPAGGSNFAPEQYTSDAEFQVFNEQQGVVLASNLTPDIGSMILSGTTVDSHFIHFDQVGTETWFRACGEITFDGDIIGVICLSDSLDATDTLLGLATVTYPAASVLYRGCEDTDDQDLIEVSGDTLKVDLQAFNFLDQIRVLTEPNTPPVANDDAYSTDEDSALVVAAPGVLGNDTDADGDPLTAILVGGPSHASAFTLNSDGSFNYTPDQAYFGGLADGESDTDSFTYKANDGIADSNVATVTITVTGNNDPCLRVDKSADTAMAVPGDTVTYTIVVHNCGDCTLGVTVVDEMVGIDDYFRLAKGATETYIIPYEVDCSDPEFLENTVTVSAIHSTGRMRPIERSWSVQTMFAHTIGFWKNHEWCELPSGSMFGCTNLTEPTLLTFFPGRGAEDNGVNPVEMLRAQLLAAELNYACYNAEMCYTRYTEADITGTMRQAEALLQRIYLDAGGTGNPDLDTWWSNLSKKQQRNVRQACEPLKEILADFNEIGDGYWE